MKKSYSKSNNKTNNKSNNAHNRLFLAAFAKVENYEDLKFVLNPLFKGKWVKEKNLHMTYKFLGDVYEPDFVIKKLKKLRYNKKQKVVFKKLKLFGKKVLSLRSSNKSIYKIHDQIQELLDVKYPNEKAFKPHITLMRVKNIRNKDYKAFFKVVESKGYINLSVCLVQSKLTPNGVKYKILREF